MKNTISIIAIIAITFLGATQASAASVSFTDTQNYWAGWANGTGDDSRDLIGTPEILGGVATFDDVSGSLTGVSFDYTTFRNQYTTGDLFINANADGDWDYVLSASTSTIFNISSVGLSVSDTTSDYYVLSDAYFSSGHRDAHAVEINTSKLTAGMNIGSFSLQPFDSDTDTDVLFSGFSLDVGSEMIIGFGPSCANDVIYETVNNPVPVPAAVWLFGSGLMGILGYRRKAMKK